MRMRRLRTEQRGYTLVELLIVVVILGIVLGGLTTIFVSGSHAELDLNRRFQAQQEARLALDSVRVDIHCASAAETYTSINGYPGVKLADGNCYSTTPTVSWCIVPSTVTARWALWRSTATGTTTCTATDTGKKLVADYLIRDTGVFTTGLVNNGLETVAVDIPVSVNTTQAGRDLYELKDTIVARNSTRCSASGACSSPPVP
jgi:prepilin-type N-terminal cleavage/methylation domain-containing protein